MSARRSVGGTASELETAIGYRFEERGPLERALVHSSYQSEHPELRSNERMEFLGDAVLQLVVTEFLFAEYPAMPEGTMAKARAASVSRDELATVARSLDLGRYLLLGRGEVTTGGRDKDSILADAMEAVICAVYLDGGLGEARRVILDLWRERLRHWAVHPGRGDFKTRLQELLATEGRQPEYQFVSEGPDHDKTFVVTVEVAGIPLGSGEGRSKKEAEQRAARQAIQHLTDR